MTRDTLKDKRPSRNDEFAATVALFNEALESFVAKVKQDRYILAAILYGSLAHDTVWKKSDIDIILVGREERPTKDFYLVENGVNIHATLFSRSKFKQMVEGSLQGTEMHSAFALSTLLYTTDDSIRVYYDDVRRIGMRDAQLRLINAGVSVLHTLAKAEKWFYTRKDLHYSFVWIMFAVQYLAQIEVLTRGEMTSREGDSPGAEDQPCLLQAHLRGPDRRAKRRCDDPARIGRPSTPTSTARCARCLAPFWTT